MMRRLAAVIVVLVAAGCASHSPIAPLPIPALHRIAIVPPLDPPSFTLENAAPPLGYPGQYWVNKADSQSKSFRFNEAITPGKLALAAAITEVVAQRLRDRGFEVEILRDVSRPADDPDNIDEEHIASTVDADAIVHVRIDEVGVYSAHLSTKYVPRVNLRGKLWTKWREGSLYSDEVDYGVDARKGKAWAISPDVRYRWGSFDELMSSIDALRMAFTTGARLAAERMADQIAASATSAASGSPGPTGQTTKR